jgi:deoxyribodipyrimidine photo-lyase
MAQITLFILTRDFRTEDALTLYAAYEESKKSGTKLCVAFRFHPDQIIENKNPYYSANAVQFMIQSLEILKESLPFDCIDPISDQEWLKYLESISIHQIFIARDFSPFARKRYQLLQSVAETIEIDDITVYPIEDMKPYSKLAPFITFVEHLKFTSPVRKNINWKKEVSKLPGRKFIHSNLKKFLPKLNPDLMVHPGNLDDLIKNLGENIKGYANKKLREQVGDPRVSYLSAFIKFGLVSIRQVHQIVKDSKGPSVSDKNAFHRELYFRDFYYVLAWYKPEEVFVKPDLQQKNPKFISEQDQKEWSGNDKKISEKEIEKSKDIFTKWIHGETEYPLINAGIHQLTQTGYMLNRLRMLTTSYLTRDNGLWWKYAEQFFANHLTDYDWTINSMNHQNIAKVGLYPKYTLDFSIKRQESMNQTDKKKFIEEFGG